MTLTCSVCGHVYERDPNQLRKSNVSYCSRACKGIEKRKEMLGTGAPWYKGGWIGNTGYHVISVDSKKYLEHRYVMEQKLGRQLTDEEAIHHIDGDKLNNNVHNLQLMSYRDHQLLHWKQKRETGSWNLRGDR